MKDRLLYLTIGLLIGIVVMQWTTNQGSNASIVSPGSGIIAISDYQALDEYGNHWRVYASAAESGWFLCSEGGVDCAPQIPVSQIKFWGDRLIITQDNVAWAYTNKDPVRGWHNLGPWPGGPVSTEQSTWGEIKGEYKQR